MPPLDWLGLDRLLAAVFPPRVRLTPAEFESRKEALGGMGVVLLPLEEIVGGIQRRS